MVMITLAEDDPFAELQFTLECYEDVLHWLVGDASYKRGREIRDSEIDDTRIHYPPELMNTMITGNVPGRRQLLSS